MSKADNAWRAINGAGDHPRNSVWGAQERPKFG